jgi:hypothetical protein
VELRRLHAGSKSEHEGVVLVTPEGSLRLRRKGANPFQDEVLEGLVGCEIECEGLLRERLLIVERWQVIGPATDA